MTAVAERPLRKTSTNLLAGGLNTKYGTLLIFPDRLVYVSAAGMMAVAYGFGALGVLVATLLAGRSAERKAAAGGKGVTPIPAAAITGINRTRYGLNKNVTEIATTDDGNLRFGLSYKKWAPILADWLRTSGATVQETPEGLLISR